MPTYDFYCTKCGSEFEVELGVNDDRSNIKCPECKSKKVERNFGNISFGVPSGRKSSCSSQGHDCGSCSSCSSCG